MATAVADRAREVPIVRRDKRGLVRGLVTVLLVSAASYAGGLAQERLWSRAVVEPLVLAILVGMIVRTVVGERPRDAAGVRFAAKEVLEVAVCLLGATMDVPKLFASGPTLAIGIVALVCAALMGGYGIGRLAGLSPKLSILVACGNAICGNSAIAAVAPVIGADSEDVAASIALTAVLGVAVVLALPALIPLLGLSHYQYGVLAGLTVYAVPQVLAAAFAVSVLSGQVATVVKLARVLMLGPVVAFFALRSSGVRPFGRSLARRGSSNATGSEHPAPRISASRLVPWFVLGFIVLAALRSFGAVPAAAADASKTVAGWLTVAAMAGLGLSVDVRSVGRVGARVLLAVTGSLATLLLLALLLIRVSGIR